MKEKMWFLVGSAIIIASLWTCMKKRKSIDYMLKVAEMIRSVSPEPMPAIHVSGNVYMISYLHDGQVYRLYFPIRDKRILHGKNVYLNIEDVNCDLNQQPGVPYFVQASDFSPEAIISIFSEDDENIVVFRDKEQVTF